MNPFTWIRKLYDRVLLLSKHPRATWWLALISFAESSFFPIPPDVMLLPMCLADRRKALRYAAITTAASVAGGLFGYLIGAFFFDSVGQPILQFYGAGDKYDTFQGWFDQYGGIMVFVAGFSPIPYKVVTIACGVFSFSVWQFVLLSIISRGVRFSLEALIIQKFGEPALKIIDKHFNMLTIVGAVLLIGGFLAVKFLIPH